MIKSMTGYGIGTLSQGPNKYNIEIKSVNARFLDIRFRGLQLDLSVQDEIRKIIEMKLHRGTINVRIDSELNSDVNKISFNQEKYELLKGILNEIHVKYGQPMNMGDIISANDLLKMDEPTLPSKTAILRAFDKALNQLEQMRNIEGEKILDDISARLRYINDTINSIEEKANSYKFQKHDKLRKKIEETLNGKELDESRLIQEVAYFVERMDVTEEIIRCKSHFMQLNTYLNADGPVGKRINFMLQEIVREINTIGSKSLQADLTIDIVEIKNELEKIREQIQNIV